MKLKELDFITQSELSKLRDYADWEIDSFIDKIKGMASKGARIPALYSKLYSRLKQLDIECLSIEKDVAEPQVDELKKLYDEIPIMELYYLFPQKEKHINQLKNARINTLGQLYSLTTTSIHSLKGIGPKAALEIGELRQSLIDDKEQIFDNWRESCTVYELPSNYDSSLGLIPNLQNAITELVSIMENRLHNLRYGDTNQRKTTQELRINILKMFYLENKSDKQIAQILGKTPTHVTNNRSDVVGPFFEGKKIDNTIFYDNILLRSGLVELVNSLKDECVFRERTKFANYTGSDDESFLSDFDFAFTKILNFDFVIPKGSKGIYDEVGKEIVNALREKVIPCSPDEIVRIVEDSPKTTELNYESDFVYNVLSCTDIVDVLEEGMIQIKYKYLSSAAQKYARIIYELNRPLTTDEIKAEFMKRGDTMPTGGPTNAKKYGINNVGTQWYYGEPRIPIQQKVSSFAEENKIFYLSDIEEFLKKECYAIPPTLRNNITNVCAVDNKDKNHFCHKEYVEDYPHYSWRNPTKYGQTNWILNEIKSILEKGKKISEKDLISELEQRSLSTEYDSVVAKRAKYIFEAYCGDDKPFTIEKGFVIINKSVYENTEFAYIGLREGMYVYYPQIRSIAANEVKKTERGRLSFEEFRAIVNEIIGKVISRNVIKRAIEDKNKRFSPIDVELVSDENGNLFIQWTKQESIPEPIYEIRASEDEQEIEEVKEVAIVEQRPAIKYRQVVNWDDLSVLLKQELSFYKLWMLKEEYNLDSSIDLFLSFLKQAENSNLRRKLPQNLYEYWFASTDAYDRNTYLLKSATALIR